MDNTLKSALERVEAAYAGGEVKNSILDLCLMLHNYAKNGKFPAMYLGGIPAGDFATKEDFYNYLTSGLYVENTFTLSSRNSKKAISTGLFEDYFGNPEELVSAYNSLAGFTK